MDIQDAITGDITIGTTITYGSALGPKLHAGVPTPPIHFVGRDQVVDKLVSHLISHTAVACAISGAPGMGKTAVASVVAYHQSVLSSFDSGVIWAGLGRNPDINLILTQWGESLKLAVPGSRNHADIRQAVANAIGQQRLLIVLDDVWDSNDALELKCGGPNCCYLITTRSGSVARALAGLHDHVVLSELDSRASSTLLQLLAPEAYGVNPELADVILHAILRIGLTLKAHRGFATKVHQLVRLCRGGAGWVQSGRFAAKLHQVTA